MRICSFLVIFPTNSFVVNRVIRKKDRLARQREEAEEALEEAIGRLRRIRKQERFLREKAAEMISRGVESLDDLEEEERREVEAAAISTVPLNNPGIDQSSLGFPEGFGTDPSFLNFGSTSARTGAGAASSPLGA